MPALYLALEWSRVNDYFNLDEPLSPEDRMLHYVTTDGVMENHVAPVMAKVYISPIYNFRLCIYVFGLARLVTPACFNN